MKHRKKLIIFIVFIIIAIFAVCFGIHIHNQNVEYAKSWHIVIKTAYVNLREEPNVYSKKLDQVKSGNTFKVLDMKVTPGNIWYKIKKQNTEGWVANSSDGSYLTDYNNPNDYTPPTLKYYEEVYRTYSIDTINYDDLDVSDDNPGYTISHVVYADNTDSQLYWITYTVTDKGNNTVSKTRKIEFTIQPKNLKFIQDKDTK